MDDQLSRAVSDFSLHTSDFAPPAPLPSPRVPVVVRPATVADVPFMDALQKRHARQVGWMPTKQLEGKVAAGQVLVAEATGDCGFEISDCGLNAGQGDASALQSEIRNQKSAIGYVISSDRYFKRDDVGVVYQVNVVPGHHRKLVGATLLQAAFDRAAYGCKLFCCWCAQDIAANRFWEAMGFVPLAQRTGGAGKGPDGKPRVHVFWQKRIRRGDVTTPWWFPAKTDAGAMRADRVVWPIPPGTGWADARPPEVQSAEGKVLSAECGGDGPKALPGPRAKRAGKVAVAPPPKPVVPKRPPPMSGALFFGPPPSAVPEPAVAVVAEKPPRAKTPKPKVDPELIAAARELRDRWLEHVNATPAALAGGTRGKYDVTRIIDGRPWAEAAGPAKLIAA